MVLPIVKYPSPVLSRICEPCEFIDSQLIDDMIETMIAHKGLGLAAPQVGVPCRLIIVRSDAGLPVALINPRIIGASSAKVRSVEGCLSIPHHTIELPRFKTVTVQALDRDGAPIIMESSGLTSFVCQHEIGHLDGRLIIDSLKPSLRQIFAVKYKTIRHQDRRWAA